VSHTSNLRALWVLLAAAVFGSLVAGCPWLLPPGTPATMLREGTFDTVLKPGGLNLFTVEVPQDLALDVVAVPLEDGALGLDFMQAPDGTVFRAGFGAALRTRDRRMKVVPRSAGANREGFHFTGQADRAGVWRFSIVARRATPAKSSPQQEAQPDGLPAAIEITFTQPSATGTGGNSGTGDGGTGGTATTPTAIDVQAIVRTGDEVPDQPGAQFTYFSNPIIDAGGRVAFYASYDSATSGSGLYVYESGTLRRIFDTDPQRSGQVPGRPETSVFGDFTVEWDEGSPTMTWGSGGRLIFVAHLDGSRLPNAILRWRASDGDLILVTDAEQTRALFPDATENFLPEFFHPGWSDAGVVFFGGRFSFFRQNGDFALFNVGVFRSNGVTSTPVVAPTLDPPPVPGQPAAARFSDVGLLTAVNADGDLLLQAAYQGGNGDRGVYLWQGSDLSRVIDNAPGRSFASLPDGVRLGAEGAPFDAMAIGDGGQIAVETTLTEAGFTDQVVLYRTGQTWTRLRGSRSQTAGVLLSGINRRGRLLFRSNGDPHLGDDRSATNLGQRLTATLAVSDLTFPTVAGSINNLDHALVRFERGDGTPGMMFWAGQQPLIVVDLDRQVPEAGFDVLFPPQRVEMTDRLDRVGTIVGRPETDRPGISGMLNDSDAFVFRLGDLGADGQPNTSDDVQAIFLGHAR